MMIIKPKHKMHSIHQILSIICMSSCIATSIADILHIYIGKQKDLDLLHKSFRYIEAIGDMFYFASTLLLYIILINRVYSSFKLSAHAMSNKSIFFWIIVISILIILMMAYCVQLMVIYSLELNVYFWITVTMYDIFLNIAMMILFTYKLKKIVVSSYDHHGSSLEDSLITATHEHSVTLSYVSEIELDQNKRKYVQLIAKITVLGLMSILCNQSLYNMAIWYAFVKGGGYGQELLPFITYTMREMEGVVNCFILYLSFSINEKLYGKVCGLCHKLCYKICAYQTKEKIRKSVVSINDMNL